VIYLGDKIYGVKWRNWILVTREIDSGFGVPAKEYEIPLFYNLHLDPKEQFPVQEAEKYLWVRYPVSQILIEHMMSLKKEPPIKPGTLDPYVPKGK
jgi:arylsulfatase